MRYLLSICFVLFVFSPVAFADDASSDVSSVDGTISDDALVALPVSGDSSPGGSPDYPAIIASLGSVVSFFSGVMCSSAFCMALTHRS